MNRNCLGKPFGTQEYAMEELRAEMASAFVFQEIGMPLSAEDMAEHVENHAAYTQNWLKTLKDDYKEFYRAVRDAVKIADYTLGYEKTQIKTNEILNTPINSDTPAPTSDQTPEAAQATPDDPVQTAKSLIGQAAIVTSAQKGRTYTGEILKVGEEYAVQKIGADRGIIHNLNKIANSNERAVLLNLPKDDRHVSISYDGEYKASVKAVTREEERESAVTR
jgi:hypothetical protein